MKMTVLQAPSVGTELATRIRMSDGTQLAATLYLPDVDSPQPCLLEALPYRKDDITCGSADSYRRLRDLHRYAVCRVDLRGTGSSAGTATDEYTEQEQADLCEVIDWLARQTWCDGNVGMWGMSYSGFNSLQVAARMPPALKAVCAVYATDDRWTDDVHWRGGALKTLELVDYCHYITAMNMLPPVPEVFGEGWREEWLRRLDHGEPWIMNWLEHNRDGAYWAIGSIGRSNTDRGWDTIACPVMLVSGWADGYRNITFRAAEALRGRGVPHRVIAGPWSHADPSVARPGPRIDLEREIVDWWDTWLRGIGQRRSSFEMFVRESTRPDPALEEHRGFWTDGRTATESARAVALPVYGPRSLTVVPDLGTAAWIDCAVDLPSGQSSDQRLDDAMSLIWEWPVSRTVALVGHPHARLSVSADANTATVSVKLCDVFPDGTSALITRGSVDLAHNGPLTPGRVYDVDVTLDACAYSPAVGHTLRLSVAGSDWPAVSAPGSPVTLTVHTGTLELPIAEELPRLGDVFQPGSVAPSSDRSNVEWAITRDVLQKTTTCDVGYEISHDIPYGGMAYESHSGTVAVNRETFHQHVTADCTYRLEWTADHVDVDCTMQMDISAHTYAVSIIGQATHNGDHIFEKTWAAEFPRHAHQGSWTDR